MGLSEVVYSQSYSMDKQVGFSPYHLSVSCLLIFLQTAEILKESGVGLRQFSPVCSAPPIRIPCLANIESAATEWSYLPSGFKQDHPNFNLIRTHNTIL